MNSIFRDTAFGQLIRFLSRGKLLRYPDEEKDFHLQGYYANLTGPPDSVRENVVKNTEHDRNPPLPAQKALEKDAKKTMEPTPQPNGAAQVYWYNSDDPENPQNWTSLRKGMISFGICLYTCTVYIGASIYVASEEGVMEQFGVGITTAELGLALYALAYGFGPMVFSPLSEIASIGRNIPYIATLFIFVILCIPTAFSSTISGFLVLRFLLGFFGSPPLANAGATFQDMYSGANVPYLIAIWAAITSIAPCVGPIVSGFSVPVLGWRYSSWELLWLTGPVFLFLFIYLPETSADNILLRRARRLRKASGNLALKSQSELLQKHLSAKSIVFNALIKPWEINILDPAVLFSTLYSALNYTIFFSFFEAFPIVYIGVYGFNTGEAGLAFMAAILGQLLFVPIYMVYLRVVKARVMRGLLGPPENRLIPALWACFLLPVGLLVFAWAARPEIHWAVSMIGITLSTGSVFIIMQCVFIYLPFSYPKYVSSIFATNALSRSILAAASVLFARPLFLNMGIGPGVSLLAGLLMGCAGGVWSLWYWGASLRAKSRFAEG